MSIFTNYSARSKLVVIIMAVILPATALISMAVGAANITVGDVLRDVLTGDMSSKAWRIAVYVRLPRLLAAIMAGAALACAGCILQDALMNPLAAPSVIGVNAGAGLGALIAMVLLPAHALAVPFLAFLGALIAALLVYAVAFAAGASRGTVILAGVAVSGIISAIIDAVVSVIPDAAADRAMFSMGSFSGATYTQLLWALPFILVGLCGFFLLSREMRVLCLGDETARGLGINAALMRFILVALSALLAGAAVSLSGLIGFVGLVSPHMTRMLTGGDVTARRVATPMIGAEMCMLCDMVARTVFAPYEISVGIVLSVVGGPFFIYLLFGARRAGEADA